MHKALGSTIADKLDDMLLISALATAPECQGKGYASTLVRMATSLVRTFPTSTSVIVCASDPVHGRSQADAQGRAVWLGSSNLKNLEFYNSLGFYTVYRISLGLNNPTWTEPPVLVDLVCLPLCQPCLRNIPNASFCRWSESHTVSSRRRTPRLDRSL